MPTTLSPTEQLSAAQNQANTWKQQQIAQNGSYNVGQYSDYLNGLVYSGNYPALEVATTAQPPIVTGQPMTVVISQPFLVIPGDNPSDSVIITNNTGVGSVQALNTPTTNLTADQYAVALQSSPNTNQGTAFDNALTTAYIAQQAKQDSSANNASTEKIIAANNGNPVIQNTPSLNPGQQAIDNATATNNLLGSVIAQSDSNSIAQSNASNASSLSQQNATASALQQAELAQSQAQITASDTTNTAQSNNAGNNTDITAVVSNPGFVTSQNTDITAIAPTVGFNTSNVIIEDQPDNSTAAKIIASNNAQNQNVIFSDQTQTNNNNVPLASKPGEDTTAQNSAYVTSSGTASSDTTASVAGGGAIPGSNNNSKFPTAKSNLLHNYVNYTYKISIYAVPKENINLTYNKGLTPGNESALLANAKFVLSDGGYGADKQYDRSFFPTDLGIDNLELETVIGTDNRTRGTDVIRMKFEVIEPYTVNFLGRLQQVAVSLNGNNANWGNTFFVMVIDFLGYDDLGQPTKKIAGTTKYIPFTFIRMKMKVSSSGGRYACDAIPVHSLASTVLDNQIPFHMEIQASTIQELFQSTNENYTISNNNPSRVDEFVQTTTQNGAITSTTTVTKGLADALNNAEIEKCKPDKNGNQLGQRLPNVYSFVIDPKIAEAKIADPNKFKEQSGAMTNPKDSTAQQLGKTGQLTVDMTKNKFNAQAGTKITDFINSILSVSTYMTDQNTNSGHDSQTVNTWKITPVIKFGEIDKGTGFYQRTIEYHITPYVMSGQDQPGFGQKTVDPNEIVKQYLYIYSGNNLDVIDANIEYNMAFFEIKNAKPDNQKKTNDNPGDQPLPDTEIFVGGYDASTDGRFFKPKYHYVRGIANRQNTGATTLDDKTIAVQNLMEKLYDNGGDMIKLDFSIIGDPDWISQDATLYGPSIGTQPYITGTAGSINFMRPAYFNFYFATPNKDYDDTTGIFDSNLTYSQFSGIFQVSMVTSNFSNGKFTQKLKNYRVRNQQATSSSNSRSDTVNNTAQTSSNNAANAPTAEPATNTVTATNPVPQTNNTPTSNTANSGIIEDGAVYGPGGLSG